MRYDWNKLNHLQVGTYGEYFVKMELTMHGFQVYTTEVDDRGIDFVARYDERPFISIQVKSVRNLNYVFVKKAKFKLSDELHLALVILTQGEEPQLFIIPSNEWKRPNTLLRDKDYDGKKSEPEYGVNLSNKNMEILRNYEAAAMLEKICQP